MGQRQKDLRGGRGQSKWETRAGAGGEPGGLGRYVLTVEGKGGGCFRASRKGQLVSELQKEGRVFFQQHHETYCKDCWDEKAQEGANSFQTRTEPGLGSHGGNRDGDEKRRQEQTAKWQFWMAKSAGGQECSSFREARKGCLPLPNTEFGSFYACPLNAFLKKTLGQFNIFRCEKQI